MENTSHEIDTTGVDIDAEVRAAEAREAEFLAKSRGLDTSAESTSEGTPKVKPDNVPEEFWDADKGEVDWDKLNDLLKNGDQTKQEPVEEETGDVVNGVKLTAKHSEDFAPFYEQFSKDGSVSEDAVKYVKETFNIDATPDMIAAYMRGQLAKSEGQASEVSNAIRAEGLSIVGGEANYAKMADWAQSVLSETEIAEFDEAVEGKDPKVAKLAVQSLWNRYRAEATIDPNRQIGKGRTNPTVGDAYASIDEMVRDMSKPEYDKDPAFRAKVDAKVARSGSLAVPSY